MTEFANFIFKIKSVVYIGSICLNTQLKLIIFYIALFNILFLLCLTDMDKHKAFFNNITN